MTIPSVLTPRPYDPAPLGMGVKLDALAAELGVPVQDVADAFDVYVPQADAATVPALAMAAQTAWAAERPDEPISGVTGGWTFWTVGETAHYGFRVRLS